MHKPALFVLLILIIVGEINLQRQHGQIIQKVLAAETARTREVAKLQKIESYWQKIVIHYPTFRDGYVQLALVDEALGNNRSAKANWERVISVDPNYQPEPAR